MTDSNTSKVPRERKGNFTFAESNLISELVTGQLNLVKGKHSMVVTIIKKPGDGGRCNQMGIKLKKDNYPVFCL
jgi:hypothetical protein